MYAEGNLAEAHVYILILVLESVKLTDCLGNLGTTDIDVTLRVGCLQILRSTLFLVPLHRAVGIGQTHLNLIGSKGIVTIVGL